MLELCLRHLARSCCQPQQMRCQPRTPALQLSRERADDSGSEDWDVMGDDSEAAQAAVATASTARSGRVARRDASSSPLLAAAGAADQAPRGGGGGAKGASHGPLTPPEHRAKAATPHGHRHHAANALVAAAAPSKSDAQLTRVPMFDTGEPQFTWGDGGGRPPATSRVYQRLLEECGGGMQAAPPLVIVRPSGHTHVCKRLSIIQNVFSDWSPCVSLARPT